MSPITRESLLTLEAYHKARPEFRKKVIAHKKRRSVALGDHVTLEAEASPTVPVPFRICYDTPRRSVAGAPSTLPRD